MTAPDRGPAGARARQGAHPQGGRAAGHRADQLDRQHRAARHAAHGLPAQPVRPRQDHVGGRQRGRSSCPAWSRPTPAPTSPTSRAACPARGRSPEDIVIPAHPPMAVDEVRYVGEAVAVRRGQDPVRGRRRAGGHRDRLRAAAAGARHQDRAGRGLAQGARGRQQELRVRSFANGDIDAAFRDAPVVIERNYRQQRLIPSAMEPRAVVAAARRRRVHAVVGHPDPARPAGHAGPGRPASRSRTSGSSRPTWAAASARSCRSPPRKCSPVLIARRLARPVKWTESRSEGNMTVHHGRDQWQRIRIAADSRRPDPRAGRGPAGRHGCLPDAGHARRAAARCVHVHRHLQDGRLQVPLHRRLHHQDADRRLPRRRAPEATFAIERIMDELAAELGMDPLELRERNWIKHEEFPFTTICRADLRLGQLRGGHGQGQGAVRLRRAPQGAGRARRRR